MDMKVWGLTTNGNFTIKSAYHSLESVSIQDSMSRLWNLVWKWPGPQRIKTFLWLLVHNRIMTNEERARRGCAQTPSCGRCPAQNESILHCLRDCPFSHGFWIKLVKGKSLSLFFGTNIIDWIKLCLTKEIGMHEVDWGITFGVAVWYLWKWRNQQIFEENFTPPWNPVSIIMTMVSEITKSLLPENGVLVEHRKTCVQLCWIMPPDGWVTLNTDGSSRGNPGVSGAGGLLRNSDENWLAGFAVALGVCSSTSAELWAVFHGLRPAWKLEFKKVMMEVDSKTVAAYLSNENNGTNLHISLIARIQKIMAQD
ncbi:Ribonuclease H protein [Quillaja saponaria]|uniref:Ribonuclease H protein n=1 Tax=Quillaja saponaria TaxID=32244 RepID=A0AAD7QI62_QUISA|nr:Ribonuclease H protein [Quillaja saponaria]